MAEIADPMAALRSLQPAIDSGGVSLQPSALYKDLSIFVDFPGGEVRTTYAILEHGKVQCIVQFLPAERIDGIPCLSIAYAAMEGARSRGLASSTVVKAIEDMRVGLQKHGVQRFYVEAIVSTSNHASQRVALRTLGPAIKTGTDRPSNEPIVQFLKLVS